jgi:23S rRNA pseudouridine1911/1915/1917 synthase
MTLRHIPPYDYQYRFVVDEFYAGKTVADFYADRFAFKPREYWLDLITKGDIKINKEICEPGQVLQKDDVLHTLGRGIQEPPVNAELDVLLERDYVFVLNKKAPIPVHPSGRYYRNTLIHVLEEQYPGTKFHPIHRLDSWTTGVLVWATEPERAKFLHRQVEKKTIGKIYGVLAVGDLPKEKFLVDEAVGRLPGGVRGFGPELIDPKASRTEFTPYLTRNGVTILKANLLTGRTNQIRIHLQSIGAHVLNDPKFSPTPTEDNIPFLGLHCRSMSFNILPNEPITVTAPWPAGFLEHFSKAELDGFF